MTVLATPTPYLRAALGKLVAGLRRDAETVRLNLAEAEQDVAAARQLLAEAEAQHKRAKDAADALDAEIAFFEREAERTPPAYDPDAALAATGLMPYTKDEPKPPADAPTCATCAEPLAPDGGGWLHWHGPRDHTPVPVLYQDNGLPMVWDASVPPGGYVCAVYETAGGPGIDMPNGTRICGTPVESEPCDRHGPPHDDLTAPGVADSRAEVARHLPVAPPVPHDPDAGGLLAVIDAGQPLTTRTDHAPSPRGQHAAPPRTSRVTGALRKVGLIASDEQDGDQTDG